VVTATGSVTIEHANAVVVQAKHSRQQWRRSDKGRRSVYKGDVVQTGADGKVGITFTDGTASIFQQCPHVLNEFVYDPNGKSNSTAVQSIEGTFTFIAGKVAKTGDMKIDTLSQPWLRGTTPHVEISDDGTVKFSTLIEEKKNHGSRKQERGDKRSAQILTTTSVRRSSAKRRGHRPGTLLRPVRPKAIPKEFRH